MGFDRRDLLAGTACSSHAYWPRSACRNLPRSRPTPGTHCARRHRESALGVRPEECCRPHGLHTLSSMAARNPAFLYARCWSTLIGVNVDGPRDSDNRMRTQRRTEADACPDLEAIGWRAVVVLSARRELASRAANAPGRCPRGTGDAP